MINVLFLCTGNSARSVLGEALLNHLGKGVFKAYSAGSHPAGSVQPLALKALQNNGIDTRGLHSKSWDIFSDTSAATMQLVLTLCDDAAGRACPVWLGDGIRCHWGLPDPAAVTGDEATRLNAFEQTLGKLSTRISALLQLDETLFIDTQAHLQLLQELQQIHQQALDNE